MADWVNECHINEQSITLNTLLDNKNAVGVLALLLVAGCANATLVPYMGVYIIEVLKQPPLMISAYTAIVVVLTLIVNRTFGRRIDESHRIAPLVLLSLLGFMVAVSIAMFIPRMWAMLLLVAPGMALANGAVSTLYSFGRLSAERNGWPVAKYNSYLRATTSVAWMLAPAFGFSVAGIWGYQAVFITGMVVASVWCALWLVLMPKNFRAAPSAHEASNTDAQRMHPHIWYAAGVCFLFSLTHAMSSSALPLYYLHEAHLPSYAPGVSFSVKTACEVVIIMMAPKCVAMWGAKRCLRIAALVSVCALCVLSSVQSLPVLVLGAALEGLYYGLFAAVGLLYVQSFAQGRMGSATSLYMNSLFLSGLIASPLMGAVAQWLSFKAAIVAALAGVVLAFVLLAVNVRAHEPT